MDVDPNFETWLDQQQERFNHSVSRPIGRERKPKTYGLPRTSEVGADAGTQYDLIDLLDLDVDFTMDEVPTNTPVKGQDYYKMVWNEGEGPIGPGEGGSARQRVAKILQETAHFAGSNAQQGAHQSDTIKSELVDIKKLTKNAENVPERDAERDLDWDLEGSEVEFDMASVTSEPEVRIRGVRRAASPSQQPESPTRVDDAAIDAFMADMDKIASVYEPQEAQRPPIFKSLKKGGYSKMETTDVRSDDDDHILDLNRMEPMERDTVPIVTVDQSTLSERLKRRRRVLKIGIIVGATVLLIVGFSLTTFFIVKALREV